MGEVPSLKILDRASVSEARTLVRESARQTALSEVDTERIALAVSELAQNQIDHAKHGAVSCRRIERGGVSGLEVVARDEGPGISDPAAAIAGLLPGKGLGVGLAGVRRAVDELDIDVRLGESTSLVIRKFAAPVPRHPEVAVIGQGLEAPSGDNASILRDGDALLLAVIDGVGHGPLACDAARAAASVFERGARTTALPDLLGEMHEALAKTRGAAVVCARWEVRRGEIFVAGVGNASARLYGPAGHFHAALSAPGILGSRLISPPRVHRLIAPPRSVLVLATDGISSRSDPIPAEIGRTAPHLGMRVFSDCRKSHDDALVLVAR